MILASVDLGTNTFHLLIIEYDGISFKEIFRQRSYVYLAEDGIKQISKNALDRSIKVINEFAAKISEHPIKQCRIVGTAALRNAANGYVITDHIAEKIGVNVEIIDGTREAELIYQGTALKYDFSEQETNLIMDIGGGSVEFILVHQGINIWSQSFKIGISLLKNKFHQSEPINEKSLFLLFEYLKAELAPLNEEMDNYAIDTLIGCSGTFEVIQQLALGKIVPDQCTTHSSNFVLKIWQEICFLDHSERTHYGIPAIRSEYIIVALALIKYVVDYAEIESVAISPYALKEGLLSEMTRNLG